mgnify:CR=1 FL=1
MPSFKPKANKKILVSKKSNVTVDSKHQEKMIEFKKNENTIIPKLKEERKKYKTKLKTKNLSIDETLELKDKIKELKSQKAELMREVSANTNANENTGYCFVCSTFHQSGLACIICGMFHCDSCTSKIGDKCTNCRSIKTVTSKVIFL